MKASQFVMKVLHRIEVINGLVPNEPLINIEEFIDARQQTINNEIIVDDKEYDFSSISDADLDSMVAIIDAAKRQPLSLSDGND